MEFQLRFDYTKIEVLLRGIRFVIPFYWLTANKERPLRLRIEFQETGDEESDSLGNTER